jgi:CubicO group peptidase (beta-lactamase class C family)
MKYKRKFINFITSLLLITLLWFSSCSKPIRMDEARSRQIDDVVSQEIEKGNIPGAVVYVGQGKDTLYYKSFGHQVLQPYVENMADNTIFDLASLTKPIATAASILILMDRGKIKSTDFVSKFLPEFAGTNKAKVQISHLLTHTSGLPPYCSAAELQKKHGAPCPENVIAKICQLKLQSEPGESFRYSCLGYILLGNIVEIVSSQPLNQFAAQNIFQPLGMQHTTFTPPAAWQNQIAATEIRNDKLLRGTVHDPLAILMGGVSGNAGLFSTAQDLSTFCQMLLQNGQYNGNQILSPRAVQLLTTKQSQSRAFGFGISSSYSWIKGDFASPQTFSHSGYTGTSIVCDPTRDLYLILLTNRAHPHDKGTVKPLRTQIANITFKTAISK